jgi:hypothetical protein
MTNFLSKTKEYVSNEVLVIGTFGVLEIIAAGIYGVAKKDYCLLKGSALNTLKLLGLTAGVKLLDEKFIAPAFASKFGEDSIVAKSSDVAATVIADAIINTGFYFSSAKLNAATSEIIPTADFSTMGLVTLYDIAKIGLIEALNEGYIGFSSPELEVTLTVNA